MIRKALVGTVTCSVLALASAAVWAAWLARRPSESLAIRWGAKVYAARRRLRFVVSAAEGAPLSR